jgi:Domain of unknown function (DUF5979)
MRQVRGSVLRTGQMWRRLAGRLATVAAVVAGVTAVTGLPAAANHGINPSGSVQNIPDSGGCGGGGRWVKFTVPGPASASGNINSGNPPWDGQFTSDSTHLQIFNVVDQFGNPIFYSAIAAGIGSANPVYTFAPTTSSPLLNATNSGNFSQFAICALNPRATLSIDKVVPLGDPTKVFTISITCTLPGSTTNLAVPSTVTISANDPVAIIEVPGGVTCSATDSDPSYTTTTSGNVFVPIPTQFNPPAVPYVVTNTLKTGSLTIKKVQSGGLAGTDFVIGYDCGGGISGTVTLKGGAQQTINNIPAGSSCAISETAAGYNIVIAPNPAVIVAGQTVTATVTNTRLTTSLTINKTQTGGAAGTWTFNVSCANAAGETFTQNGITITGTGTASVSGIPTGLTCTVTEANANTGGFVTTPSSGVIANVAADGTASFTNVGKGSLKITKVQNGGPTTQSFTISYDCGGGVSGTVTLKGGEFATVGGLTAGSSCTVTEAAPAGYTSSISAPNPVVIEVGGTAVITVTNTRDTTSLTINKTQTGGAAGTWTFNVSCSNAAGETFTQNGITISGTGTAPVSGIPTGLNCTVTEVNANTGGFDTTPSTGVATAAAGGRVNFTNVKRAGLTITKTQNGGPATFQYTFRLTGGPDNVSISKTTLIDPNPLNFGLVKPGTYTLCELEVAAGTTSTLENFPGATVDATTGTVCAPITLLAGDVVTFTIDNQLRSGGQHTIGYWRNWATCATSGGVANRVANAAATGKTLLDATLPQTLGSYKVDTCTKGVAVLSNPSARYAENQLAAQLMAAKANVYVGAACGTILTTISQADALLTSIGYTGPVSTKLGTASVNRTLALSLASTLDQFNNGLLC